MKKKLLVSVVLLVSLFVAMFSFTSQSKAVNVDDPEFALTGSQQKDILKAYDLDHNGKITSYDVSLMKRKGYPEYECSIVQSFVVYDMKFSWIEATVKTPAQVIANLSCGRKILYVENYLTQKKKVYHLLSEAHDGTFIVITYYYGK